MPRKKVRRPNPNMCRQQRWAMMRKAMKLCPVCSAPTNGYSLCPRHLAMQRERMRKRTGVKFPTVPMSVWENVDWRLGVRLLAKMLNTTVAKVKEAREKLKKQKRRGRRR